MSDLNYLDEVQESPETAMSEVMRMVDALQAAQRRVEELEDALKNANSVERMIREQTIPGYMAQHRLNKLELENGLTVSVSEELALTMPKDENKRKAVVAFLLQHEGGELVKEVVSFEDADEEIITALTEKGITYERKIDVNTNSLKAWFRRTLGLAKNSVQRFAPSEVPEEVNLYLYKTTKIS